MFTITTSSNLSRWKAFAVVAHHGSIARAAEVLELDSSIVSRQINSLETDCGMRLFMRHGRGMNLTESGAAVLEEVKKLLSHAEVFEKFLQDQLDDPAGRISIGALESMAPMVIRSVLPALRSQFPRVAFTLLEGPSAQMEDWLHKGKIDLGILYRYGHTLRPEETPLARLDTYLIGAPGDPVTREPEIEVSALRGIRLVLPIKPNGLIDVINQLEFEQLVSITERIHTNSLAAMKALVVEQGFHTLLPIHAIRAELKRGELQGALVKEERLKRVVTLSPSKSKGSGRILRVATAAIHKLAAEMAELPTR
ncbi:LysR family transcriptional regulator [Ottowia thiooxydans]|uniref:LysR family transcriptional regulator n=1 Tax=Ottowia thiooxydans TaxID=219182 RepID=UPI0006854459|nr:LysR family transcriptional regulator [Ottowia thiooxydans]